MKSILLLTVILITMGCEWPFETKPTDEESLFQMEVSHNVTRLTDSALVVLTWSEITVEQFSHFTIERMVGADTVWILLATIENPLVSTYRDTIVDDEDYQYRVTIEDVAGKARSASESISIPKTTVLYVPSDYNSIQDAFKTPVTDDGDSILVAPGLYEESLVILGKKVLIKAVSGYTATTVRASAGARCLSINGGVFEGFRLEGGTGGASPYSPGGGVYASGSAILRKNFIVENKAPGEGGGVYLTGEASLYNNIIYKNAGNPVGGIIISYATGEIINNTIAGDTLGGVAIVNSEVKFYNNIIHDHISFELLLMDVEDASVINYSLFKEAGTGDVQGNISGDPLFFDPANADFRLSDGSPAIDAGHPGSEYRDIDGSRNDMGAFGGPGGIE